MLLPRFGDIARLLFDNCKPAIRTLYRAVFLEAAVPLAAATVIAAALAPAQNA